MISTLIYKNDWEYELHMVGLEDNSKKRQSIGYFVKSPDGKMSEIHTISRSKILTAKNWCNFVYDLAGDFDRSDVDKIKNEIFNKFRELKKVEVSEAVGIDEAYLMLCKYVVTHSKEDSVYKDDEGYCNIETKQFESILKELDMGYKKIQILRALKVKECLKVSQGRSFDYKLYYKDGSPYWAYRIENIYNEEEEEND